MSLLLRYCSTSDRQIISLASVVRQYSSKNVSIAQILNDKNLGKCEAQGWIRNSRKQKEFTFLDVVDGSTSQHLQVVAPTSIVPIGTKFHSALRVAGELIESSHPGQALELVAQEVDVVNSCEDPYPIQPRKQLSQNLVRQYPSYKHKTNGTTAMLRMRNRMTQAIHQYFQDNGYLQIHTPILTSNDCEGGGEVFKISSKSQNSAKSCEVKVTEKDNTSDKVIKNSEIQSERRDGEYFDKPVYLTVSGQLHLEAACNGIAKVYTFNPAFRAEKGRTRRHLSEFWMVEAELAFIQELDDILIVMEDLIKHTARALLTHSQDLQVFAKSAKIENRTEYIEEMLSKPFNRITFADAKNICEQNSELEEVFGDFSREHELFICQTLGGPVFVYNWPKESKPFYMRECTEDRNLVSSVDLLVPGVGELCGGGLREFNLASLQERISGGDLAWYADLRGKGSAPTAGFGLGFERLIQWLVGAENIKDTIPFYRASHECQM